MNTKRNLHSSVPDIMLDSADDIEISVAPDTLDALFSERGSTHFPEARNRRRDDQQDEELIKLRSVLKALDEGTPPENGVIEPDPQSIYTDFYKQF